MITHSFTYFSSNPRSFLNLLLAPFNRNIFHEPASVSKILVEWHFCRFRQFSSFNQFFWNEPASVRKILVEFGFLSQFWLSKPHENLDFWLNYAVFRTFHGVNRPKTSQNGPGRHCQDNKEKAFPVISVQESPICELFNKYREDFSLLTKLCCCAATQNPLQWYYITKQDVVSCGF